MIVVKGKAGISATILRDSINVNGDRMLTFELEYPRLILAELNTHAMLAKSSFSSRAVPFEKMLNQLTGVPVRFGANQAGMQDKGEDFNAPIIIRSPDGDDYEFSPMEVWEMAKKDAIWYAKAYKDAGYHKQVYNRLLETYQMMKTVLSATEFDNFWWLRDHSAADPTLAELARCMREASEQSTPTVLRPGDWHLPYVDYYEEQIGYEDDGDTPIYGPQVFYIGDLLGPDYQILTLEEAIMVSCARCAAVSYRNEGYGLEKSIEIYNNLVGGDRKHASAFEHCAKPIKPYDGLVNACGEPDTWEPGISHMDRDGNLWSGKFKGWIQFRKLIPGENYTKPKKEQA